MTKADSLKFWLKAELARYTFDVAGVARLDGVDSVWPVTFNDSIELRDWLSSSGRLHPLPAEPAALANILEHSIADFLEARATLQGIEEFGRGTERGYPDIEFRSAEFGPHFHAVDIKVARRKYVKSPTTTQSRITLYTGNTYFKWPNLHWPGTPRPFSHYASHLDIVMVYTFDAESDSRVVDPEIFVHESWRIASKQRSSTTREYIGAVQRLADLREGNGEFASLEDFYSYWRKFPFKVSAQVAQQLETLVRQQEAELVKRRSLDV